MAQLKPTLTEYQQEFQSQGKTYSHYSIRQLEKDGFGPISRYPYSLRVLLENLLRYAAKGLVSQGELQALASWQPDNMPARGIPFMPARIILQDFTGVPALVDLAALRSAAAGAGADPATLNPSLQTDLVIDHSVQVDAYGSPDALSINVDKEMERNHERYAMLHWGQKSFKNFRVVPPGTGIVHQVNLEYLASVAYTEKVDGTVYVYPDSVLGTDSHTTMINGLGVMGWGVGGIEAEAVLLGQPYILQIPEVIGVRLTGTLSPATTATDLVLTITQFLREKGVVGRFVEFFGPALPSLTLPDRATIANMAPEYGATMGFFPVDEATLRYLTSSGRSQEQVTLVKEYFQAAAMFYGADEQEPEYSTIYEISLDDVVPSLAGPRRPQDRLPLPQVKEDFQQQFASSFHDYQADVAAECNSQVTNGSVVLAAITSCTNTSNPDVMIGAGLLARKAVQLGLRCKPWVKTSMAPGSKVVTRYLQKCGLLSDLETLGFHVVGYGCTTCIGNSGPLDRKIAETIDKKNLITAAVLSGNRNFEARIHPQIKANYLGSPLLVIAYALTGSMLIDIQNDPLGQDGEGNDVYLKDIWPSSEEIGKAVSTSLTAEIFSAGYNSVFDGNEEWNKLDSGDSSLFPWDEQSLYIREPSFFLDMKKEPQPVTAIAHARILAIFGDTITTDHISPAGAIPENSPAGQYLISNGIQAPDFNSYGSRRGNHEVMVRGTFANIRIRNTMVEQEGGYTRLMPENKEMTIFDAAMHYKEQNTPLVVFAGKEYGTGSSRDWAAKGTMLLGVKAVVASSYERIHRSNLIGMGVLPLQFETGTDTTTLKLTGEETVSIQGLNNDMTPGQQIELTIEHPAHGVRTVPVILRLDNEMEIDYYRHGGILNKVLRQKLA